MSSHQMGFGLPASPSDGLRARRADADAAKSLAAGISAPGSMTQTTEKEAEISRSKQSPSQHRLPSRVPLPSSTRQPAVTQPTLRRVAYRQSKSWGSTTSASSYLKSHTQTESGSSSSIRSYDGSSRPGQRILQRKKSSISHEAGSLHNDSSSLTSPKRQPRVMVDSALGIRHEREVTESPCEMQMEDPAETNRSATQPPVIYPELDRYRIPYRLATHDLPPPTPGSLFLSANGSQISAISGSSPSTKFSESPGPGPYSRDTTPTSISSQSPGLIAPCRVLPLNINKSRQHSPSITRPPVTRRRTGSISNEVDLISIDPHGLPSVRESLASSSSNSTVRESDRTSKKGKTSRVLVPLPPSPPPRKSSQKFHKSDEEPLPKKKGQPTKQMPPESSSQSRSTPQPRPHPVSSLKTTRPSRPSRDGTPDLKSQLFSPVPVIQSNLASRSARVERRGSESTISNPHLPPASQLTTSHISVEEGVVRPEKLADQKKFGLSKPPGPSTPTPNAGSSFNTRFPFFGRRKTAATSAPEDKRDTKLLTRKGPAAGTGHEGYGRIGAVRRRSGSFAASPRSFAETKLSQDSLVSHDPFLADRIRQVVIAGGEVVENRNASSELSRTESNQSLPTGRSSTDSNTNLVMSSPSINDSRTTLWPSAIPRGSNPAPNSRRPSDSSDSSHVATKPTIAYRRSIQRLRTFPGNTLQLPHPINTSSIASSPMTSFDTSIVSDVSSLLELQSQVSHDSSNVESVSRKLKRKMTGSTRIWNPFSRSQSKPTSEKSDKVAVTVRPLDKKPVAFYAIIDPLEQEETKSIDIHEILRRASVYSNSQNRHVAPEPRPSEFRAPDVLQPAVGASPQLCRSVQQVKETTEAPYTQPDVIRPTGVTYYSGRPSRLLQVGRIPQLISNRSGKASTLSFSRPFGANVQPLVRAPDDHSPDSSGKALSPSTPVPYLDQEGSTTDCVTEFSFCSESASQFPPERPAAKEFIAFSQRQNSDCTTDTSSSDSVMCNSYVEATAVIPRPDDPPAEDEIWAEYDDLLGNDNAKGPQSATSSMGVPFHLEENYQMELMKEKPLGSPTLVANSGNVLIHSGAPLSGDPTASLPEPDAVKQNLPEIRHSTTSSHKPTQSGSSSSSGEWSPLAQVNLRVGSMTVSKWLTFGHVLFSDIRHELVRDKDSLNRLSILVVDGLGNDDWSFYAAETYPAANFFNLSPRAPLPTEVQNSQSSYPLSPPNHHQIQYLSHLDKFPFGPQGFDCVVYRFPVAAPESYYRNIISEARRVLKPDGYIELSILDVDLNNMGNRGRRTVRHLKERIHEKTPETSLASTADLMVRLLGSGGFSTIKAARVGIPVACSTTQNKDSTEKRRKLKDQPSLPEMMRDNSPMADEGITSMVARVGRWWYTRCYENAAGSSSGKSIWNNKSLLQECEEVGTSLKLMVCCARAPERTKSV